jgi:hypothetical protein
LFDFVGGRRPVGVNRNRDAGIGGGGGFLEGIRLGFGGEVDPLDGGTLGSKVERTAVPLIPGERVDISGGIVAGMNDMQRLEGFGAPDL